MLPMNAGALNPPPRTEAKTNSRAEKAKMPKTHPNTGREKNFLGNPLSCMRYRHYTPGDGASPKRRFLI